MSAPPKLAFGHTRRGDFVLAPGIAHLNHGSFGATPKVVLQASDAWRARMEADPSSFYWHELRGHLRAALQRVGAFLGGSAGDWVFVENTTVGLNAVIASLRLQPGDELVCLSQVYGAIGKALQFHAQRAGATVVEVPVPVPFTDPQPLLAALRAALNARTRIAVLDHVTSTGATVLPAQQMAAICRAAGVPVAIDGAHAPGQLALDVPVIGADWYVGNLHKWAFAPKGTAVVWVSPQRQAALHPVTISHYLGQGFASEFDYYGTRDNSAWLASTAAFDYLDALGPQQVRAYNDALADEAARMLAEAWGTELSAAAPFRAAMASVRLPPGAGGDVAAALRLAHRLRHQHGITAAVVPLAGALWLRISAQVYNEPSDYLPLAALGTTLCATNGAG